MTTHPALWLCCLLSLYAAGCSCGGDDGDADADVDTDTDSDSDTDSDTGTGDCEVVDPEFDEIDPQEIAAMPGDALAIGTDWTTAVVCGMDFVVAVDLASGDLGASVAIPAPCTGASVDGDRAAVVDRLGNLIAFEVGAAATLTEIGTDTNAAGVYEDVLVSSGTAYVAARALGILRFDVSGDAITSAGEAWTGATDARAIAPDGDGFAVGDGEDGAKLLGADGSVSASLDLGTLMFGVEEEGGRVDVTLPREGDTIAISGSFIVAGSAGYGYEWATRSGDTLGEMQANGRPNFHEGPVFDVAIHGDDEILYAEGQSIRRMRMSGNDTLTRLASEYRADRASLDGGWFVGVEAGEGEALLLATNALYRTDLPEHQCAPDLDVERQSIYALVPAGESGPGSMSLRNYGDAALEIRIDSITGDGMSAAFMDLAGLEGPTDEDPDLLRLMSGGSGGAIQIEFAAADNSPVAGLMTLATNDVDETSIAFDVNGNPDVLEVGEAAPDFALTSLDGTFYRRSDHLGDVVLLMFFNST